jgi:predicted small secreted protein
MKNILSFLIAIAALAGLSACNTVKGVGQDIQKAGGVLEDAAKKK